MAVTSAQVSVTTSATALNTATNNGQTLYLKNGATAVTLGPSTVTATTGLTLTSASLTVFLSPGEVLYGITASGTSTVEVLRSGT